MIFICIHLDYSSGGDTHPKELATVNKIGERFENVIYRKNHTEMAIKWVIQTNTDKDTQKKQKNVCLEWSLYSTGLWKIHVQSSEELGAAGSQEPWAAPDENTQVFNCSSDITEWHSQPVPLPDQPSIHYPIWKG